MTTPKLIVVTGVECAGKSTLCEALATFFSEPMVTETARAYLENQDGQYAYEDLEKIARLHLEYIKRERKQANHFLFIDTAFYVLKIWSEERFGKCCPFILNQLATLDVAAYILCAPIYPWVDDPLREHPNSLERNRLHLSYLEHISNERFCLIEGNKKERLDKAALFIQSL